MVMPVPKRGAQTGKGPHRKNAGLWLDRRVVAAISVALVITIGLSCLAITGLTETSHRAAEIRDNWLYATRLLGDLKYTALHYRQRQAVYLILPNGAERGKERKTLDSILTKFGIIYSAYAHTADTPTEQRLVRIYLAKWRTYLGQEPELFRAEHDNGRDAAIAYYAHDLKASYDSFEATLDEDIRFNENSAALEATNSEKTSAHDQFLILCALGVVLALGIFALPPKVLEH